MNMSAEEPGSASREESLVLDDDDVEGNEAGERRAKGEHPPPPQPAPSAPPSPPESAAAATSDNDPWVCDVCRLFESATHEEALEHERTCKGHTDLLPPPNSGQDDGAQIVGGGGGGGGGGGTDNSLLPSTTNGSVSLSDSASLTDAGLELDLVLGDKTDDATTSLSATSRSDDDRHEPPPPSQTQATRVIRSSETPTIRVGMRGQALWEDNDIWYRITVKRANPISVKWRNTYGAESDHYDEGLLRKLVVNNKTSSVYKGMQSKCRKESCVDSETGLEQYEEGLVTDCKSADGPFSFLFQDGTVRRDATLDDLLFISVPRRPEPEPCQTNIPEGGACQQTQDTADIALLRSPAALHGAIRASRDRLFFIRTHNSLQLVKVDLTATQEHEVTQTHMVDGVYYVEFFAIYSKDADARLSWDQSRWRIRWHNYKFGSDGEIEYDDKMSEFSPHAQPDPDKYIAYADFVCLCDSDIFIAGPFDFDEPKLKGWRERIPPYIWEALVGALREKSQNELMPHLSAAVLDDMGGNTSIKAAKSSSGTEKADDESVSRSKRSRTTEENGTIPVALRKSRRTEGASRANERDFHTSFEFVSGYRQSDPSGIGVVAKRRILPRSKFTDVYSRYFHGSPPESKCSERGNIIKAREGYFDLCPSHSQWINEARGEETPNIKFCMGHDQTLVWKVTRQIEAGEELLVEYGGYDGSAKGR